MVKIKDALLILTARGKVLKSSARTDHSLARYLTCRQFSGKRSCAALPRQAGAGRISAAGWDARWAPQVLVALIAAGYWGGPREGTWRASRHRQPGRWWRCRRGRRQYSRAPCSAESAPT